jgi:hypothetical protein
MGLFPRPCLDCGGLTSGGSRCTTHQSLRQKRLDELRKGKREHYKGDYTKRAKLVRESAELCWICGGGYRPDDAWTADHYYPGDPYSPLLPAHKSCNSRRGNRPPSK